jgi:NAD dependent epimerase/dehydratase family
LYAGGAGVFHTATLHKPHVATHGRQVFIDTNISGTLNLLEEAAETGVEWFVFTSTTSVFGDALIPPNGAPAAWITEEIVPVELGWKPKYDFNFLVEQLKAGKDTRSPLARLVGSKGYHAEAFAEGPYPTLRE